MIGPYILGLLPNEIESRSLLLSLERFKKHTQEILSSPILRKTVGTAFLPL
jgi:hypothetical protein